MRNNKKLVLLALPVLAATLLLSGCVDNSTQNSGNTGGAFNLAPPVDPNTPLVPYQTKQFQDEIANDDLSQAIKYNNNLDRGDVVLGAWTISQYVNKALENGYFVANWWGAKDNYSIAGLDGTADDPGLSAYLTSDLKNTYHQQASGLTSKNNDSITYFTNRIYMPTTTQGISVEQICNDQWSLQDCFYEQPTIISIVMDDPTENPYTNFTPNIPNNINDFPSSDTETPAPTSTVKPDFSHVPVTTMNGTVTIEMKPMYLDANGNQVDEPRTYTLRVSLTRDPTVAYQDGVPYYYISAIDGEVTTGGVESITVSGF